MLKLFVCLIVWTIVSIRPVRAADYTTDRLTRESWFAKARGLSASGLIDLEKSAAAGDLESQMILMYALSFVSDLPKDPSKALHYALLAAEQKNPFAQAILILLRQEYQLTDITPEQAFSMTVASAAQDNVFGIMNSGLAYMVGIGTTPDLEKAAVYLSKGYDLGHPEALKRLCDLNKLAQFEGQHAVAQQLEAHRQRFGYVCPSEDAPATSVATTEKPQDAVTTAPNAPITDPTPPMTVPTPPETVQASGPPAASPPPQAVVTPQLTEKAPAPVVATNGQVEPKAATIAPPMGANEPGVQVNTTANKSEEAVTVPSTPPLSASTAVTTQGAPEIELNAPAVTVKSEAKLAPSAPATGADEPHLPAVAAADHAAVTTVPSAPLSAPTSPVTPPAGPDNNPTAGPPAAATPPPEVVVAPRPDEDKPAPVVIAEREMEAKPATIAVEQLNREAVAPADQPQDTTVPNTQVTAPPSPVAMPAALENNQASAPKAANPPPEGHPAPDLTAKREVEVKPAKIVPKAGADLPNMRLYAAERGEVMLYDLRGTVLLLDLFSGACQSCRKNLQDIATLKMKYGKQGLDCISVDISSDENDQFELPRTPTTLIVDKDGRVAGLFSRFDYNARSNMEHLIKRLLTAMYSNSTGW